MVLSYIFPMTDFSSIKLLFLEHSFSIFSVFRKLLKSHGKCNCFSHVIITTAFPSIFNPIFESMFEVEVLVSFKGDLKTYLRDMIMKSCCRHITFILLTSVDLIWLMKRL